MFRLLLRLALLLTLLVVLPIALIRAQPYDDSDLRAFLTPPEGCPAPCFTGIRPGVTTTEEAIAILEAHEWVASVGEDYVKTALSEGKPVPLEPYIHWTWSGSQPNWIDSNLNSRFLDGDRQVYAINIDTHIRLGDILLTYGMPDNAQLTWNDYWRQFYYEGWYPLECMYILAGALGSSKHVYLQPVKIWFQSNPPNREQAVSDDADCGE
jgi:hypothetical protein